MTAFKKRIVPYLVFILLGSVCVFVSAEIAGFAAYMKAMAPPSPSGMLFSQIEIKKSNHSEVATLFMNAEGKIINAEEFLEFLIQNYPCTECDAGDTRGRQSVLCFATKTWAMRVYFDDKGIAICKQLRW